MNILRTMGIAFGSSGHNRIISELRSFSREADKAENAISKLAELDVKIHALNAQFSKLIKEGLRAGNPMLETVKKQLDALEQEREALLNTGAVTTKAAGATKVLGAALGVAALAAFAFKKALDISGEGEKMLYLAHAAGIAADSYQKLANASKLYGGSAQGVAGMTAGIAKMGNDLRIGAATSNGLTEAARRYRVAYHRNGDILPVDEILDSAARVMGRLTKGEQLDLKQLLGLDEGTFNLMLEGHKKYRESLEAAKALEVSEGDLSKLRDFSKSFKALMAVFRKEGLEFVAEVAPFLQGSIEGLMLAIVAFGKALRFLWGLAGEIIVALTYNIPKKIAGWFKKDPEKEANAFMELVKASPEAYKDWKDSGYAGGNGYEGFKNFLAMGKANLTQADAAPLNALSGGNIANTYNNGGNTTNNIAVIKLGEGERPSEALRDLGFDFNDAVGNDLDLAAAGSAA